MFEKYWYIGQKHGFWSKTTHFGCLLSGWLYQGNQSLLASVSPSVKWGSNSSDLKLCGLNKIIEVVLLRVPVLLCTCSNLCSYIIWASLVAQMGKHLRAMQETWVQPLGQEDPLEKETATNSSILAWRLPWTEKPDRLQSMGLLRVRPTVSLTEWLTFPPFRIVG